jgi:hypothetical protein
MVYIQVYQFETKPVKIVGPEDSLSDRSHNALCRAANGPGIDDLGRARG